MFSCCFISSMKSMLLEWIPNTHRFAKKSLVLSEKKYYLNNKAHKKWLVGLYCSHLYRWKFCARCFSKPPKNSFLDLFNWKTVWESLSSTAMLVNTINAFENIGLFLGTSIFSILTEAFSFFKYTVTLMFCLPLDTFDEVPGQPIVYHDWNDNKTKSGKNSGLYKPGWRHNSFIKC